MAKIRTHYDNLRVARDASTIAIKEAYEALFQAYHPDKYQGNKEDAKKIMELINASYEVLINPVRRAKYDAWIREYESVPPTPPLHDTRIQREENILPLTHGSWIRWQESIPKWVILIVLVLAFFISPAVMVIGAFIWMMIWCFSPTPPEQKIAVKRFWWPLLVVLLLTLIVYPTDAEDRELLKNIPNLWSYLKPAPKYAPAFNDSNSDTGKVINDMKILKDKMDACRLSMVESYPFREEDPCKILHNYTDSLLMNSKGNSLIYWYSHLTNGSIDESNVAFVELILNSWDKLFVDLHKSSSDLSIDEDKSNLRVKEKDYTYTRYNYYNLGHGKVVRGSGTNYVNKDVAEELENKAKLRDIFVTNKLKALKHESDLCLTDMGIDGNKLTWNCRRILEYFKISSSDFENNDDYYNRILMELYYGPMMERYDGNKYIDGKGHTYRQALWSYYQTLKKLQSIKIPQD